MGCCTSKETFFRQTLRKTRQYMFKNNSLEIQLKAYLKSWKEKFECGMISDYEWYQGLLVYQIGVNLQWVYMDPQTRALRYTINTAKLEKEWRVIEKSDSFINPLQHNIHELFEKLIYNEDIEFDLNPFTGTYRNIASCSNDIILY